jgi:urate oxidase / 2-oxo-4-hydroxy-4-carboxy-5-ureidoimidazoline decarboxylase
MSDDRASFLEHYGAVFESSPWVAEAAWEEGPFETVAELHVAMVRAVERAPVQRQLELIRAHPELAGSALRLGTLTPASAAEQAGAGLDRLQPRQAARLARATAAYRERFGFPFVVCVREHTRESIIANVEERLLSEPQEERRTALAEIAKIAALRLEDDAGGDTVAGVEYGIAYGKESVPVYRHYATPLAGIPEVPESSFTGRDNVLFAHEVTVEVHGDNFLPAYTRGDNSGVVATDSMKNFILRQAGEYEGPTLEGYLARLGRGFLDRYEQMQEVRVSARELPFSAVAVPGEQGFEPSPVLRQRQSSDRSVAELRFRRDRAAAVLVGHRSGRVDIELLKPRGSAFTRFVRDEYTTLPERSDRPLFIRLDVHWTYSEQEDAAGANLARYVAGEQVRDVCAAVFHQFVSESIQHLVHEMGKRLLERYPQLRSLHFVARNLTRDPYAGADAPDDERTVFVPPFPAFGTITLTMTRSG